MPVLYNGKKLIPAPLIDIKRELQKTGDGTTVGVLYTLTVQGTVVAYKGSPDSNGTFWTTSGYPNDETIVSDSRLTSILKKQEAIKLLFATDGYWFEIQPWDGSASTKCKPRILDIAFANGIWFDTMQYTITMQTDELFINGSATSDTGFTDKISTADESWTIEFNETPENTILTNTFRLTHNISAVGKSFYNDVNQLSMPAWQQARNYVQDRIGLDYNIISSSGALNVPGYYQGFNHVRSENVDEANGNYGISESWILASGNVLEELNIEVTNSITEAFVHVSINGSVQGLETRNNNYQLVQRKYDAASGYFNNVVSPMMLARAQNYAGITLNTMPITYHIGRNPIQGLINYGYEYNDRPSNCVANAKSEVISIIDNNPTDVFAAIPILGRAAGPLLQAINTTTAAQRQINIELIMPTAGSCSTYMTLFNQKPDVSSLISAASGGLSFTQIFKDQDQENWSPKDGRYSRTVSWTYQ